jgi:hypothetical protein
MLAPRLLECSAIGSLLSTRRLTFQLGRHHSLRGIARDRCHRGNDIAGDRLLLEAAACGSGCKVSTQRGTKPENRLLGVLSG